MAQFETRKQKIIEILLQYGDCITAADIASNLKVCSRTVRNEINAINSEYQNMGDVILTKRGHGFLLNPDFRGYFEDQFYMSDPDKSEDQLPSYIQLLLYLLDSGGYVNLDDLSDTFYRSVTSIRNDMKDIRVFFRRYKSGLQIRQHKNSIGVFGPEDDKRSMIKTIIDSTISYSHTMNIDSYTSFFDRDDLLFVYDIMRWMNEEHPVFGITAMELISCTLRLLIAQKRIRSGYTLEEDTSHDLNIPVTDEHIEAADHIWDQCEEHWEIRANATERMFTAYDIAITCHHGDEDLPGLSAFALSNDNICRMVVRRIISDIKETYLLDLTAVSELETQLATLILKRMEKTAHTDDVNPLLLDIEQGYPFIFEVAIFVSEEVEKSIGTKLSEDELSFVALYLCTAVEKSKLRRRPAHLYTLLFNHADQAVGQFILAKLETNFGERLYINGPYPLLTWDEHIVDRPQLILSTSVYHPATDVPVLTVSPLLSDKDVDNIETCIAKIDRWTIVEKIRALFLPEVFFPDVRSKNMKEIIKMVSEKLSELGFVGADFLENVHQRERISSTAVQNNIAVPHPINFCAYRTCIALVILPRAIDWFGRKSQFIFFPVVTYEDRAILSSIYDFIVDLSGNIALLQQLARVRSFEDLEKFLDTEDPAL